MIFLEVLLKKEEDFFWPFLPHGSRNLSEDPEAFSSFGRVPSSQDSILVSMWSMSCWRSIFKKDAHQQLDEINSELEFLRPGSYSYLGLAKHSPTAAVVVCCTVMGVLPRKVAHVSGAAAIYFKKLFTAPHSSRFCSFTCFFQNLTF